LEKVVSGKLGHNTLRTVIVVAAFVILLGYVLLVEGKRPPPPAQDATPTPTGLLELQAQDIVAITITDEQQTVRLGRQTEGWEIAKDGPADAGKVDFAVAELASLDAKQRVSDQMDDPATFGLANRAWTITIETLSGEQTHIRVGRETPDGTAFYVQREDDPALYIVAHFKIAPFYDWLTEPPFQLTATPGAD
jgi:hypothetical protein